MDTLLPSTPPLGADRVDVCLLGGFSVEVAAAPVADARWPSLRARHLVQLLCLAERHRLTRDQVIESLWPQLDPDAGAANLRKAAHHARQALGRQDAIVLQGGEVAFFPAHQVNVDAVDYERRARAALAAGDPAGCAAVAARYGGDLLPGTRYEGWSEPPRERLRALQLALLRASAQWEALARAEPTDEPAHRALMERELHAGNRAAAIRWYAHVRTALQQTLGVAPEPSTEALYRRCIAGLERSRAALVGRAIERARIGAWIQAAPRQRPGGVVLTGPAGIGKSALCREIEDLVRDQGWDAIAVDAAPSGRPYLAVATAAERLILEGRAALDAVGAPARAVLALLTPLAGPPEDLPGPLGRHQVIGAFRRLLVAATQGTALLLRVDDAHLLDDADVDVLLHLVAAGPPVFVLLAARSPAPGSALALGIARLASAGSLRAIELAPLEDADLHALIAQATPGIADDVAGHVLRRAGGNPFIALELARSAVMPGARLPASVAEAMTARLCDVSAAAHALLQRLALAGDAFDARIVVALAHGNEAHAFAVLDAALRAEVLVVSEACYRFRHELVRQALVDQVPPHRRLKMHREVAQALAELDVPAATVGRHWLAGGSPREASAWLLAAAQDALRLAAFADALRHLEPVLAFQSAHPEALRLRAEALDALGDPAALAAYREAADATAGPLAHDLRAKGALAQVKQGDPKGALQALQGVAPSTVEGLLSEALAYCGAAALGATDPAIGTRKAAEARRLALQSGDKAALVVASWAQAAAAHARGELHQSVWTDLRETRHLPDLAVRVFDGQLCILQRFLYGARPYPEVIEFAEALASEARRIGAMRGLAFGTTIRGEAELLAGDLDAAEEHLTQGAQLHHAIGAATGESFSLQRLAEVAMHRGRMDEARERLDQALDLARQTDIGFHLLDRIYGTRIALADASGAGLSAVLEARAAVRGPLETCPGCRITFAVPAAIAAARAADVALAQEYEAQTAYLANVVMRLPAWYAAHEEVRGHLALARGGSATEARAHFTAAAAQFRAAGQPLDAARCDARAAQPERGTGPASSPA
jgi:DNA-binding SARP family transcriptional activator